MQSTKREKSMKPKRILPVLAALLLLSGCTFPMGDELLAAPKPSTNYQTLQVELEERLASGVSYTAPTEGDNRSAIQLIDINGDGVYWLAEIGISSHLYRMLPYLVTLVVLAFTSKKSRAPKAEGIPYDKGKR